MIFRGQIYNTKEEWSVANDLAHNTLKGLKKYTSKAYDISPILTTDNKFVLVELKGFETKLSKSGFEFEDLDESIIKVIEINN